MSGTDSQRIDKWLWYTRFFRTRGLASQTVQAGKVRLGAGDAPPERVSKASAQVRPGDVLTFPQGDHVRVVKVLASGTRRGPAAEARTLYEDLAPPGPRTNVEGAPPPLAAARERGAGRPTKKERRAHDPLKGDVPES